MSTTPIESTAALAASTNAVPLLSSSSSPSISFITHGGSSVSSPSPSLSLPSSIPSKLFTTVEASSSSLRGDYIKHALSQPLSWVQERFAEVAPSFTSPTLLRNSGHWGIS
jgi:hypothetical protein